MGYLPDLLFLWRVYSQAARVRRMRTNAFRVTEMKKKSRAVQEILATTGRHRWDELTPPREPFRKTVTSNPNGIQRQQTEETECRVFLSSRKPFECIDDDQVGRGPSTNGIP
jgi:hypothetical protein